MSCHVDCFTFYVYFVSAFSDKGQAFEINSVVISAATDPKPTEKLTEPVIIASTNLEEVDVSFSCIWHNPFALIPIF